MLERFGFGTQFLSLIKLLYFSPKASVITNRVRSKPFPLSRGTRQGCHLSPLLFTLAIEPLSIALRCSQHFTGINSRGIEHRISLYADDLLLYLSDPIIGIPQVVKILNQFGTFSGYKLNFSKSVCFPINNKGLNISNKDIHFQLSVSGFKYLGINITQGFSNLYTENFAPLIDKLKLDLKKWNLLFLSLAGRINCVKMNILPRFLYLFQCIPIFLPKSFFQNLDRLISSFIWGGNTPRIRKEFLQRSQGGLALPNFRYLLLGCKYFKSTLLASDPQRCLVYFRGEFLYFFIPTCFSFIQIAPLYFIVYSMPSCNKYPQDLVSI